MSLAKRIADRLMVIHRALDGTVDKMWAMYVGRIKRLEQELADAHADRDRFKSAFERECQRAETLERWLIGERQDHENTHARLVRAAKRCVKYRDELQASEVLRDTERARRDALMVRLMNSLSDIPNDAS